jgi:uncharacterized SAM-binding protein YcdF (DUF218 family)
MRDALVSLGVNEGCILLETASLSTAENATRTSAVLRRLGLHRAVLVTNHWHLPRALADFRRCGVEVSPLGAESAPVSTARRAIRYVFERLCQGADLLRLSRERST